MAIIDAHSHLYPRLYVELLKTRTRIPCVTDDGNGERFAIFPEEEGVAGAGRLLDESFWSSEAKLDYMDRVGIDQAVVSLGNPWLDPFDDAASIDLARQLNEEFAQLEGATAGRLVGLGVLPTSSVEDAVTIAREVAATPTLHGLIGSCRVCGLELDDERLTPLWEQLDQTELPLFIHPHDGVATDDLAGYGTSLPLALGFPFETTIALAKLVLAGVLHRFPRLRILAAHGGGTLPFLAARLDVTWRSDPTAKAALDVAPSEQLARLYLDAVLYHPRALRAAASLVGADRMVFGTDHPFFSADPRTSLDAVEAEFSDGSSSNVLAMSAQSLFRLTPRT